MLLPRQLMPRVACCQQPARSASVCAPRSADLHGAACRSACPPADRQPERQAGGGGGVVQAGRWHRSGGHGGGRGGGAGRDGDHRGCVCGGRGVQAGVCARALEQAHAAGVDPSVAPKRLPPCSLTPTCLPAHVLLPPRSCQGDGERAAEGDRRPARARHHVGSVEPRWPLGGTRVVPRRAGRGGAAAPHGLPLLPRPTAGRPPPVGPASCRPQSARRRSGTRRRCCARWTWRTARRRPRPTRRPTRRRQARRPRTRRRAGAGGMRAGPGRQAGRQAGGRPASVAPPPPLPRAPAASLTACCGAPLCAQAPSDLRPLEEVKRAEAAGGWRGLVAAAQQHRTLLLGGLALALVGGYVLHQQGVFAAAAAAAQSAAAEAARLWAVAVELFQCVAWAEAGWADALAAAALSLGVWRCLALAGSTSLIPSPPHPPPPPAPAPSPQQAAAAAHPHPRQREGAAGDDLAAAGLGPGGAADLQDPGRLPRAGLPGGRRVHRALRPGHHPGEARAGWLAGVRHGRVL